METWTVDWAHILVPTGSLAEVVLRGTIMYFVLFPLLRLVPRRQIGAWGVPDLLVVVLIVDAAQNGFAGQYRSVTKGIALVVTILFWDYVIDWFDHKFPRLHLDAGAPLAVVQDGRFVRANMQKERVSEEELMSQLRQRGVEDVRLVKKAYIEGDGRISIIRAAPDENSHAPRTKFG